MTGSKIKNFHDLKVWQDAHSLALDIYRITRDFPKDEQFGLVSQMRRAASSVTANIAEGFGRFHYNEKTKFYRQARGSAVELQDHIFLSQDLGYSGKEVARGLFSNASLVIRELNGLIRATGEPKTSSD